MTSANPRPTDDALLLTVGRMTILRLYDEGQYVRRVRFAYGKPPRFWFADNGAKPHATMTVINARDCLWLIRNGFLARKGASQFNGETYIRTELGEEILAQYKEWEVEYEDND